MQALPITGQNDSKIKDFDVSSLEFNNFLKRHNKQKNISENNYEMQGSYVMIDPIGRFFNNSEGKYVYSSEINKVGIKKAMNEANYCFKKFINRDGMYQWE